MSPGEGTLAHRRPCPRRRHLLLSPPLSPIHDAAATSSALPSRRQPTSTTPPPPPPRPSLVAVDPHPRRRRLLLGPPQSSSTRAVVTGEAEAILAKSQATARAIRLVSEAMRAEGSTEAANLRVAEQYIKAFDSLAKKTNTILLPSSAGNPSSFIAQTLQIYKHICLSSTKGGSYHAEELEEPEPEEEEADSAYLPSVTSGMPSLDTQADYDSTFSLQRRKDKH